MRIKNLILSSSLFILPGVSYVSAQDFSKGDWGKSPGNRKREADVNEDKAIERKRVTITQKMRIRSSPSLFRDDVEFERLRRARIDEKTVELIGQLETLIARKGQESRKGELGMRLAELYYERAQALASKEAEGWEKQVKQWEALSVAQRKTTNRPTLSTPKADNYRRKALRLYVDLERDSRGGDYGASRMIRRDEVLFFLGSTLLDLGSRKQGMPHFEELVNRFPKSARAFSARLTLADLFFESSKYDKALSYYLKIAAGEGMTAETENLRPYALYKLAWCYLNTTQYEKSVKAFEKTLEVSKNSRAERRVAFEKEAMSDLAWAYALASMYDRGETYFANLNDKELLRTFRRNAAELSRDRGEYDQAKEFYEKLLKEDTNGTEARGFALEIADLYRRQGQMPAYGKALAEVGQNYGEGSSWLRKHDATSEEKKALVEEFVSLVRREAKSAHAGAQKKDRPELYQRARPLYEAYFKVVPNPNPDTKANVHEMSFYYGELLYKMGDFKAAADIYGKAGDGKYGSAAAFARVLAFRSASQKDSSLKKDLARATEDFVRQYPDDEKSAEILYSGAYDAFNAGQTAESLATLRKLVDKFSDTNRGVESAERILFITEKNGDIDAAIAESTRLMQNDALVKTGGKDFEKRLTDYLHKAQFKRVEKISDSNAGAKARAYLDLSKNLSGELKEKALNNANVYAKKAGDAEAQSEAQQALLKSFPASNYAKDIYFTQAEAAAKLGSWASALKNYDSFLKAYKKDNPESEKALWNSIYIQSHLEDVALVQLYPRRDMSADLLKDASSYLENFPKGPNRTEVGSSRVDLQACKLEYSIVSPK